MLCLTFFFTIEGQKNANFDDLILFNLFVNFLILDK